MTIANWQREYHFSVETNPDPFIMFIHPNYIIDVHFICGIYESRLSLNIDVIRPRSRGPA